MTARPVHTGPFGVGDVILDKFEVKGLLGKGGYAFVYHCHNTFLAQEVAIKLIPQMPHRGPQLFQRARAEAQVLSRLNHPNLVRVMDGGDLSGMAYIVMEKLDGMNLREFMTKVGPLTPVEALSVALQVAEALEAAHELGVIHRDLKPDNIFLLADNHVKVLDFGIAKFTEGYQTTQKDLIQGTAPYMSPEQAQGHGVTPASDIFQLGIVMYEMIAGICPCMIGVEEPTPQVLIAIQVAKLPPRLKSLVPSVPEYVDRLIWRAIAKHPHQRFPVMKEFTDAIRGALERLQRELPARELVARTVNSLASSPQRSGDSVAPAHAPQTTPIALVTPGPGLPMDTEQMPVGGPPPSMPGSEQRAARSSSSELRHSAPPAAQRNSPSVNPGVPLARRTPNGRAIAAALASKPALPAAPTVFNAPEPSLSVQRAPRPRHSNAARRMLTRAVLIGCAIAIPAGVGIVLIRHTRAASTVEPTPSAQLVMQKTAEPVSTTPPAPAIAAEPPAPTIAVEPPSPSIDSLASAAPPPATVAPTAPSVSHSSASISPAKRSVASTMSPVGSGLDAPASPKSTTTVAPIPKPAAPKPSQPAPNASAPAPRKLIF